MPPSSLSERAAGLSASRTRMDSETERAEVAKRIHERARFLRGRFLNSVAVIERDIAIILTDYFCTSDSVKREVFFRCAYRPKLNARISRT